MILLKTLAIIMIVAICFLALTFSIAIGVEVGMEMFFRHKGK